MRTTGIQVMEVYSEPMPTESVEMTFTPPVKGYKLLDNIQLDDIEYYQGYQINIHKGVRQSDGQNCYFALIRRNGTQVRSIYNFLNRSLLMEAARNWIVQEERDREFRRDYIQ